MARTDGLKGDRGGTYRGRMGALRSGDAIIAADNSTLTDANIPPASAIDCTGYDSIFLTLEHTGGTSTTADVEPLFYDADAADGSRWKRIALGSRDGVTLASAANQKLTIAAGVLTEFRVFGWGKVFLRIDAVASATGNTAWKILGIPGQRRS